MAVVLAEIAPISPPQTSIPLDLWDRKFSYLAHWAGDKDHSNAISRSFYTLSALVSAVGIAAMPVLALWHAGKNFVKGDFRKSWNDFTHILSYAEKYVVLTAASIAGAIKPKSTSHWLKNTYFDPRAPSTVLDTIVETFSITLRVANQYAEHGSFFGSRLFYLFSIGTSLLAILAVLTVGVVTAGKNLMKGNLKESLFSLVDMIANLWRGVKLTILSVLGTLTPLPINRLARGIDKKEIPQKSTIPLDSPNRSKRCPNLSEIVIDLIKDACEFFSWCRH